MGRLLDYARHPGPLPNANFVTPLPPELQCSLDQAYAVLEASAGDIRAMIVAITGSSVFLSP